MMQPASALRIGITILLGLFMTACASQTERRPLSLIYNQAAQYHEPDRNPIIVIPGILGSRLVDDDTGRTVWGAFDRQAADPNDPKDALLLALPISAALSLEDAQDSVRPDGVLERVRLRLLGIPIGIRAYVGILSTLGAGGYRDEGLGLNAIDYGDDHFTCFQFDYDWRRDNVENAARLKEFIDERRAYIQEEYRLRYGIENAEVKFDIVAHSMGGLLTRYFMRYGDADLPADGSIPDVTWAGAEDVERVILVGTPNAGASNAFEQLLNGFDPARPVLPHYPAAILGTYPSIYQLLPRPRHNRIVHTDATQSNVDNIYDVDLWAKYGWGLAAENREVRSFLSYALPEMESDAERHAVALDYLDKSLKRAEAFHNALDMKVEMPEGLDLYLVAGDAIDTPDRIGVDPVSGKAEVIETALGDGTVPRHSALLDERTGNEWEPLLQSPIDWTSVQFIATDHLGLTTDPGFANNVLFLLLEDPRD
ncbi:MAG: hypothetical protein AAFX02_05355 [Pseudomonadota bacterium]